jgi:hypothetical protein
VLSINYFPTLILELVRQHSNYLRFRTSMDYHLEITKRVNCVDLFYFFRDRGNNITFFFFFLCVKFS